MSAGMMIGPASNFILSQISVSTPLGELDKLNSPGLVMALSWALYSLVVASLYTDLDTIEDETRILREMEDEDRQMSVQQRYSALEDEPLLRYTEVNSLRDQRMTSDIREIQSEDLSQYNASPRNPVKLSGVPECQSYGPGGAAGREEVTVTDSVSHEPTEDTVESLRRQLAVETAAKDKIIEVLVCILFFVKFAFEHFRQKMLKSSH